MLRSEEMKRVTLIGHKADRERVIQQLHKLGLLQFIDLKKSDLPLENGSPSDDVREISDFLLRVSHLLHILKLAPVKQTFTQKLFGLETLKKARVKQHTKAALLAETAAFLNEHEEQLQKLEQEYETATATIEEMKEYRQVLQLLFEHEIPIDVLEETQHLHFVVGKIPLPNVQPLKEELWKGLEGRVFLHERVLNKKFAILVVITLREDAQRVHFTTKKYGVTTFAFRKLPPKDQPLVWVEQEIARAEKKIADIIAALKSYHADLLDETIFLREELELLKERFEAVHKVKESKQFFVLQGWVTAAETKKLKRIKEVALFEEEVPPTSDAPVKLSNPGFLKPFEMLTELYALPKYRDLDPTFIVAPLFLIFAGFMLTDFVYGFGLVILGALLWLLFRKHDEGMKHTGISIFFIGVFAMIFGVLTGSYLGDAPKYFFGIPTAKLAIWKDPLADPLYFLIISLVVGLIHLNIGLVLGLIEDVRLQRWKTLLSDRIVWWLLQLSILAFVLHATLIGEIILGITLLLIVVLNGPLGLLDMTGFMGDVISYSRLFALALSTAGIAMTVNLLADMMKGVPAVGLLLAGLIFLIGHIFSFLMNALGSFVHSIRLQFVEFFGKFYEGGGDKFEPFREERIYTEVVE